MLERGTEFPRPIPTPRVLASNLPYVDLVRSDHPTINPLPPLFIPSPPNRLEGAPLPRPPAVC